MSSREFDASSIILTNSEIKHLRNAKPWTAFNLLERCLSRCTHTTSHHYRQLRAQIDSRYWITSFKSSVCWQNGCPTANHGRCAGSRNLRSGRVTAVLCILKFVWTLKYLCSLLTFAPESHLERLFALGTGLLLGAALGVIIPESVRACVHLWLH